MGDIIGELGIQIHIATVSDTPFVCTYTSNSKNYTNVVHIE